MDGPDTLTAGTLLPASSKQIARAINAASGNRPVVVLANLSGFDGSPESMRRAGDPPGCPSSPEISRFLPTVIVKSFFMAKSSRAYSTRTLPLKISLHDHGGEPGQPVPPGVTR